MPGQDRVYTFTFNDNLCSSTEKIRHGCAMWWSGWLYGLVLTATYSNKPVMGLICLGGSLLFGLLAFVATDKLVASLDSPAPPAEPSVAEAKTGDQNMDARSATRADDGDPGVPEDARRR